MDNAAEMVIDHIRAELEMIKKKMRPVYNYWVEGKSQILNLKIQYFKHPPPIFFYLVGIFT